MPDRVDRLREAAQARHDGTLRRATNALQRLARRGEAVTLPPRRRDRGSVPVLAVPPTPTPRGDHPAPRHHRRPPGNPALRRAGHHRFAAPATADLPGRDHPTADREPGTPRPTRPAPRRRASRSSHQGTHVIVNDCVPGVGARSRDHGKASRPRVYVTQSDGCNETLNHPHVGSRGVYTRLRRDGRLTPMASVRGRQCRRLLRGSRTRQAGRTLAPATPPVTLPPSAAGRRPSR